MARNDAEILATQMLGWIAADEDRIGLFLGASGMDVDDLKRRAAEPDFLGFVIDFMLGDEGMLLACCEALSIAPDQPMRARMALPGGDIPHWT
ncbi:DUF3572 domain-containing protein [Rhodobacteraceae bacterium NNCM2]|nr:DUF3572 domain-containing protein [Coraliihabitans acroporae]